MKDIDAKQLLIKYQQGTCTENELALLESWYLQYKEEKTDLGAEMLEEARQKVWASLPVHQIKKSVSLWPVMSAVASIVILITVGLFFFRNEQEQLPVRRTHQVVKIVPGGNKAVLTLADGTKISLNDAANGQLANQSGIVVTKAKDGQLIYTVNKAAGAEKQLIGYNTISTPRGGFYQINLPDGTKVWMNAASSLKYPTAFTGGERKVELTGEGYFEVAHQAEMPFRVATGSQVVEVLGTHFNINAYDDENDTRTTLVEGKVRLSDGAAYTLLNPGEQGIAYKGRLRKTEVNTDDIIAWKENKFVFNNEKLGSIMRQIARWYDVEVVCPPELEDMEFSGTMPRHRSIKQALKIMDLTESVHFKFEGRRITVMP